MTARMLHGDATALPLEDESVDCVVTSPPYNVGMGYEGVGDTRGPEEYQGLARAASAEMFRVLRDDRRVWVNVVPAATQDDHERPAGWHSGRTKAPRLLLVNLWMDALTRAGFTLIDLVAWVRIGNNSTAWGSFRSPASPNLRGDWESVIVACKGGYARATPDQWKGWKDDYGPWTPLVSTVWSFSPGPRVDHPCPFPDELPARCIRLSTWPGETVLDPFAGSGATVRMAYELGRHGVGVDLSEEYVRRFHERGVQEVLA